MPAAVFFFLAVLTSFGWDFLLTCNVLMMPGLNTKHMAGEEEFFSCVFAGKASADQCKTMSQITGEMRGYCKPQYGNSMEIRLI